MKCSDDSEEVNENFKESAFMPGLDGKQTVWTKKGLGRKKNLRKSTAMMSNRAYFV